MPTETPTTEARLEDYVINKVIQIGIRATSHEEALRAVMAGRGDMLATNYSVTFRQQPMAGVQPQQQKQLQRA